METPETPRMQNVADVIKEALPEAPYLKVKAGDNLMSSVWVNGTYQARKHWANGLYRNSPYFTFFITPPKRKRYYDGEEKVTVELSTCAYEIKGKFRKYTGPIAKVAAKIAKWIEDNRPAPVHCTQCAQERGVAIPASCPHQ